MLQRPINRPCGALFDFPRLPITMKFLRSPTTPNPAPIATFTADYCGFEFFSSSSITGTNAIWQEREHLSDIISDRYTRFRVASLSTKICRVCGKGIESPRSASQYEKWNKGICYSCDGDVANREEELRLLRQAADRKAQRETLRKPKNWRDCWTYPAVVPHAGGSSRIASDIRQALDQFKTTSVEEFAAAFQEAIDHQDHHGMLDERERWIKGPSDRVVDCIASKITAASQKPGFTGWKVLLYSNVLARILIFRGREFSFCLVGTSDQGDVCALNAFHPKYF